MPRYLVVRTSQEKRKSYARPDLFVEVVSAPSKKALRGYYLDWDNDTPDIIYTTVLMKRWKKED
jgi:hypothetical protein